MWLFFTRIVAIPPIDRDAYTYGVSTIFGTSSTQFLDVTIPIERAIQLAEPKFARRSPPVDPLNNLWFKDQVNHDAPWDIKRERPWRETIGSTYPGSYDTEVIFQNKIESLESIGNMTYGYLGTAMGYPLDVLLSGGDYADGGITGLFSRSDSHKDKSDIVRGVQWYNRTPR